MNGKKGTRAVRRLCALMAAVFVFTAAGGAAALAADPATASAAASAGASAASGAASQSDGSAGTSSAADQSKIPLTNLLPDWPQYTETLNEASAVLIDADTGGILYSLNRDEIRYPASTTKIMTALLTLEHCKLNDTVTMKEGTVHCTDGSTNAATVEGETFTVEQCLYMLLLKSANDIAVQLGIKVAGSTEAFADMMNERAEQIGCTDTHFVNASGMPDSDHYTTAYDLALIMQECLKNKTFRKIISTTEYTVPATNKTAEERVYPNHNLLIQPASKFYYQYDIGGKTGFTKAAWRTLVTAAEKDGRTLIAVTMRGPDQTDFSDAKKLFEYGFSRFANQELNGVQVTLPAGMGTDQVEQSQEKRGDGTAELISTYHKLTVGRKTLTESEAKKTAAAAETPAESGTLTKTAGRTALPVLLAVFAVLVAGIIVVGVQLFRGRKD